MLYYILKRLLYMVFFLALLSVVGFLIIELPPGSYLDVRLRTLKSHGTAVDENLIASLIKQYDLDSPTFVRYFKWIGKIFRGEWGVSFHYGRPIQELIGERLPTTILLTTFTLLFVYAVSIPIGIYSATHQYSVGDYAVTFLGFIGLATPNFLLALILMFFGLKIFGIGLTGLFSAEYVSAAWSLGKFVNLLKHLPIPIIVIGTAGTAGLIRVMRGCLLDELRKQYVITARAKGVRETQLLFRYAVRVAINPVISTIGWELPAIFSGEAITAIVLALPTTGTLFYSALITQDMYLAASIVLILGFLVVIGTLVSDFLLVWVDPRIRLEKGN